MSAAPLPLADPQFWLVTAAAAGAVIYLVRKRLRVKKKGAIALPCENCSQADVHAPHGGPAAIKRWILGQKKAGRSA